jgi:preprotein translocase subunit YajC
MVATILITGQTYPLRRELRGLGGIWNHDRKGYIAQAHAVEALREFAAAHSLSVDDCEVSNEDAAPATGDQLREIRQARQDRLQARLLDRAQRADRRGDEARARISTGEREFLSLMEPVKRGHHSQRRHEKLLKRAQKSFIDAGREYSDAEKLRRRAEHLAPARVAGDAARARQEARDRAAALISAGDKVRSIVYGDGIVTKTNKNSFTVNFADRGFTMKLDKSHVSLLEKGSPEAAAIQRKFKTGDEVVAKRGFGEYRGKIVRCTPRGYSVEYSYVSRVTGEPVKQRDTFAEYSIQLAEQEAPCSPS